MNMLNILKWAGTTTGILGALLVAMNIPESGYGFVLFTASSVAWSLAAFQMKEWSLLLLQSVFFAINLFGISRWLII